MGNLLEEKYPIGKPRFPISIEREFVYRAVIEDTEEILESEDFKTLYHAVLRLLRGEVGKRKKGDYARFTARIEFGYNTYYNIRRGYAYNKWMQLKDIGVLYVSTISEEFYRVADGTFWARYLNEYVQGGVGF